MSMWVWATSLVPRSFKGGTQEGAAAARGRVNKVGEEGEKGAGEQGSEEVR
jgi:hypothetical protein